MRRFGRLSIGCLYVRPEMEVVLHLDVSIHVNQVVSVDMVTRMIIVINYDSEAFDSYHSDRTRMRVPCSSVAVHDKAYRSSPPSSISKDSDQGHKSSSGIP